MVKLRLHGTPEENQRFIEWLKKQPLKLLTISDPYPDTRGKKSEYERVYIDLILLDVG